jgi:hypothetical protein
MIRGSRHFGGDLVGSRRKFSENQLVNSNKHLLEVLLQMVAQECSENEHLLRSVVRRQNSPSVMAMRR